MGACTGSGERKCGEHETRCELREQFVAQRRLRVPHDRQNAECVVQAGEKGQGRIDHRQLRDHAQHVTMAQPQPAA